MRRVSVSPAAVVIALVAACSREATCPDGTATDDARTGRLRGILARDAEGAGPVTRASDRVTVCHGDGVEVGLVDGRVVLLDRNDPEPVAAARMAHLLVHVAEGEPMDPSGGLDCAARLERARDRERRAHELEGRIRARLAAPAAPPDALDRVLAAYAERCRASASGRTR